MIAAGSLLEFVLENEKTSLSFPVGRVRFLNMKPLSFREFMQAIGQGQWEELLQQTHLNKPISEEFHTHLLQFVRDYFLIGGMPAAVQSYINTRSYVEAQREHRALLAKYGQKNEAAHLQRLFNKAPFLVAKHFRYSKSTLNRQTLLANTKIPLASFTEQDSSSLFTSHQRMESLSKRK